MKKLSMKEEAYCQGRFQGLTQIDSYKRAYNTSNMKDSTAYVKACILEKKDKIRVRINELTEQIQKESNITVERVLAEYAKFAFFNPKRMFNEDGTLKKITEMDDDTAAAIAGIDIATLYRKSANEDEFITEITKKIKHVDKKGGLDSIAKYLGMFKDEVNVNGKIDININYSDDVDNSSQENDKQYLPQGENLSKNE